MVDKVIIATTNTKTQAISVAIYCEVKEREIAPGTLVEKVKMSYIKFYKLFFFLISLFPIFAFYRPSLFANETVSSKTVRRWLIHNEIMNAHFISKSPKSWQQHIKNDDTSRFSIDSIQKITLAGEESAYIASCSIDSSRSSSNTGVLIRPSLKKALILRDVSIGRKIDILDLDSDGISEIVSKSGFGMGGYLEEKIYILSFDRWQIRILHLAKTSSNVDALTKDNPEYFRRDVDFAYSDFNHDRKQDLLENWTIETHKGTRKYSKKYIFAKSKYIPINTVVGKFDELNQLKVAALITLESGKKTLAITDKKGTEVQRLKKVFSSQTEVLDLSVINNGSSINLIYLRTQDHEWLVDYYWDSAKDELYYIAQRHWNKKRYLSKNLKNKSVVSKFIRQRYSP